MPKSADSVVISVIPHITFKDAYKLQQELFDIIYKKKRDINFFLLLEHPHVITLGRNAKQNNLLVTKELLQRKGIELIETDRGGDITYHGPGQIVGYPILELKRVGLDVKSYVYFLEEIMIQTCKEFGIKAHRISNLTGTWVGEKKIGSIGVRIQRWITLHGFAFNVNTNLDLFKLIIPCGIQNKEMTSLESLLKQKQNIPDIRNSIIRNFIRLLGCRSQIVSHDQLLELLAKLKESVSSINEPFK
ncbi:MAG: lipoyl(octanoyl) transferase LipB [Planctomycetes bacterium]|nr:lipoyl(octanoyl) transferase LipB [Planctomycetota bacterium]